MELQFLPAREGDSIWVRWGDGHQLFIDMGKEQTGLAIRDRLNLLPPEQRVFDLLVVTHVDGDHIGGVLTCVTDAENPVEGLEFADVWFNGWEHLHGRSVPVQEKPGELEAMGAAQGERFTSWLRDHAWNAAFAGGPVFDGVQPGDVPAAATFPVVELPDGLKITVLGPSLRRLADVIPGWQDEVELALAKGTLTEAAGHGGLEPMGSSTPPVLDDRTDLEVLAGPGTAVDGSDTNGSSIVLLLEHGNARALLTGDGFGDDIATALGVLGGGTPVELGCVKLPHHGSRNNVSRRLVEAVDSPTWVFSSDGSTFKHPDAESIGRILLWRHRPEPALTFNVPSRFNGWWDDDEWRARFGYTTTYGTKDDGVTVVLPD